MHQKPSSRDFFQQASERLTGLYPKTEAQSLVYWLMEDLFGVGRVQIALGEGIEADLGDFHTALDRLEQGEPIQYVLGYAWFREIRFEVAPGVLIPRPETETAVEVALNCTGLRSTILDIGTGSGCIAVSIAKSRPEAEVLAWDISTTALGIARRNSDLAQVVVNFREVDVLGEWPELKVDCIVSNPPYVLESEKEQMHQNVLDFEPAEALFVPDDDALRFYRAIATRGREILSREGHLVLEINERFALEMRQMLLKLGYQKVEVVKDLFGKDRVVTGKV